MKRALWSAEALLIASATALIAASYGLVRLGYGLVVPDAQATLGLTSAAAGMVGSLGSLSYCVALLAGIGAVLEHPTRVVIASGLCGVIGSLGIALAPTAGLFGAAAVLASASAGLASPATMHLVAERVAARRQGQAQGVVNAGTGRVCSPPEPSLCSSPRSGERRGRPSPCSRPWRRGHRMGGSAGATLRPRAGDLGSAPWSAPWRDPRLYPSTWRPDCSAWAAPRCDLRPDPPGIGVGPEPGGIDDRLDGARCRRAGVRADGAGYRRGGPSAPPG